MSESRGAAHVEHHREGFIRHYIFSLDHKMIGRQFLFSGLFMLVIGGLLAMMVRWQLGFPGTPLPLTGIRAGRVLGESELAACYACRGDQLGSVQHAVYHARHHHDLLRGDADYGRGVREFFDSDLDRCQ